jgi:hypothetical protein
MNPDRVEASRARLSRKAAAAADEVEAHVEAAAKVPPPMADAEAAILAVQNSNTRFFQRVRARANLKAARDKTETTEGVDAFNSRLEPGLTPWTVPELFVMGPRFHRPTSLLLENRIAQDDTRKKLPPTAKELGSMFGAMLRKGSSAQPLHGVLDRMAATHADIKDVKKTSYTKNGKDGDEIPNHADRTATTTTSARSSSSSSSARSSIAGVLRRSEILISDDMTKRKAVAEEMVVSNSLAKQVRGHAFFRHEDVAVRMQRTHRSPSRNRPSSSAGRRARGSREDQASRESTASPPPSTSGSRTGRKIYLHALSKSTKLTRCPRVMQSFRSTSLSLRGRLVGGFTSIWLTRNTFIADLDLSDNLLGDRGLVELFTALQKNPAVRNLTLARVGADLTASGAGAALQACLSIDTTCRLQSLNLDGNKLTDTFCQVAFGGVDIRSRPAETATASFRPAKKLGNTLRALSLQDNELCGIGSGTFDAPEHSAARCVQKLTLGWNHGNVGPGAQSPATFCRDDQHESSRTFALSFRRAVISTGTFIRLRALDVSYCALSDAEGRVLAETLASMPILGRIRSVDASGNRFGHQAATAFGRVVLENAELQSLRLSQNTSLGVAGVVGIIEALSGNKSLAECWIDGCMSVDPLQHDMPPNQIAAFVRSLVANAIERQQAFRKEAYHSFMETTHVLLNFLPGAADDNHQLQEQELMTSFRLDDSPWKELLAGAKQDIREAQEEASVAEVLMMQVAAGEADAPEEEGEGEGRAKQNTTWRRRFDPELSKHLCRRRRVVESKQLLDTPFFDECFASDWADLMARTPFMHRLISCGHNVDPGKYISEEGELILQSPYLQDAKAAVRRRYSAVICLYRIFGTISDDFRVNKKGWGAMIPKLGLRYDSATFTAGKCLEEFQKACAHSAKSIKITVGKADELGYEAASGSQQGGRSDDEAVGNTSEEEEAEEGTDHAASRSGFIEALVRLALLKYGRSKKDAAEAISTLFDRNVVPYVANIARWRDADGGGCAPHGSMDLWRAKCYLTKGVSAAMQQDEDGPKNILASFAGLFQQRCEAEDLAADQKALRRTPSLAPAVSRRQTSSRRHLLAAVALRRTKCRMSLDGFVQMLEPIFSHTLTQDAVVKCFKMAIPASRKSPGRRSARHVFGFLPGQDGGLANLVKLPLPCFVEALWRVACFALIAGGSVEGSGTAEEVMRLLEKWSLKIIQKK